MSREKIFDLGMTRQEKALIGVLKKWEGADFIGAIKMCFLHDLVDAAYDSGYNAAIEDAARIAAANDADSAKPPYVVRDEIVASLRQLKKEGGR